MIVEMRHSEALIEIARLRLVLKIAAEETQEKREANGLPELDHIGRWEHKLQMRALEQYVKVHE